MTAHTTQSWSPAPEELDLELLTRERLIRRWQHGSDSFFWRMEKAGQLVPKHWDGLLRYAWPEVFAFEGGVPPDDLTLAYRQDLLTEHQVAAFCVCSPGKVITEAKAGRLPCRRIGRAYRFVPAEVERWQRRRWRRRPRSRA